MLGNIEDDIAQSLLDLSQTPIPNKPSTALPVKPSTALPVKSYNLGQQGLDPVNASHPQSKGDFTQKQSDAHPHCTPMLGLNQQAMKFYQSQQRLPSPRHGSQEERKDPSPCQTLPIPTPALFMLDVRSRLSPLAGGSLSPHRQAACSAGQQRQSPHRQRQQLSPRPPVSPRHHPLGLQPLLMPAVTLQLPGSSHSPQRSPRHSPLPMSMISPRLPQMRSSQHNSPHASHDDNVVSLLSLFWLHERWVIQSWCWCVIVFMPDQIGQDAKVFATFASEPGYYYWNDCWPKHFSTITTRVIMTGNEKALDVSPITPTNWKMRRSYIN